MSVRQYLNKKAILGMAASVISSSQIIPINFAYAEDSQSPVTSNPQGSITNDTPPNANATTDKDHKIAAASLSQLKKTIKQLDTKNTYKGAIVKQKSPNQVGTAKVEPTPPLTQAGRTPSDVGLAADQVITIERPPLKALISVYKDLNPFGLDADTKEYVTLRDVLLAASGANLDILHSVTNVQTHKWLLRQSLSDYLPSITLGFNELGLKSTSALPIQSSAVVPGSAGGPVQALATKTIIDTPLTILNSGFSWKPIQGGRLLFSALAQKHRLKASKAQLNADISNTLLKTADDYYNLIYNDALLQIRSDAVSISEEQVRQNTYLEKNGLATNLDVLQAKTQLSKDKQNLVDQQRIRRAAAMKIAHALNMNLGQDLLPTDTLRRVRLVSQDLSVNKLLTIAIDKRPELKQYEELRLAAKKQIMVAQADFLPTVSLGGNIIGLQSKIGSLNPTYLLNFGVSWKLDGLGMKTLSNSEIARWQARQAMLEANKKFLDVMEEVRNSYNETLTTEIAIDEATNAVISAEEELRLAKMRLDNGLGTNLDVLTAQRDLTQARIDKALALMNFNRAQAKLVRDIGLVSIDSLSSGQLINSPKQ